MERSQADDWTRLEQLFHTVSALSADDRADYLDRHCDDADLRRQVEQLVANADQTGISARVSKVTESLEDAGFRSGDEVGPWRILRRLADGGMGSVFLAERADGQYSQQAALKVLRSALPGGQLTERFVHERQILAQLNHPHIAHLLDGGATAQGLPYLAMEYIDGEQIDQWCRARSCSLRERLGLFQKICGAVQAAHQSLVVHRDIKPSNIIVDASGEPKLLDFGIARLLDQETGTTAAETQFGQRMLTPEFASPEQIRGDPVDTRSDVYSLGVLLYILLTGRSPYAQWRTQPLELQKAVCETEPESPSLAATRSARKPALPPTPPRELKGDLDHIVLKAMRKEPDARYASPEALADDLQRFSNRQPIRARAGSRRYRAGKFLRRNLIAVSATAAVALAGAMLVSFYTLRLQAERDLAQRAQHDAEQQRAAAEHERAAAEKSADFMVSLFTAANADEERPDLLARDLLAFGAQRVSQELADQPLLEARLQRAIGRAYWSLALFDEGEARMRRALQLLRQQFPAGDLRIAELLEELARELGDRERYDDALDLSRQAMDIYSARLGPDHPRMAGIWQDIDRILAQRDHDASMARYEASERARQIYLANDMAQTRDYAILMMGRSAWHKQRFEWDQAVATALEGIAIQVRLLPRHHMANAYSIEDLARLHYFRGDYRSAVPLFEEVMTIVADFKGASHVDMDWSLYYRARIAREQGDRARARQLYEHLIANETATPQTPDNRYLARALCGYALVLADAGDHAAARQQCARGQDILAATAQKRIQMDVVHEGLGIAALAAGDAKTALRELSALAALRRQEHDPAQTDTPLAIGLHATALASNGKMNAALALNAEALELASERYGPDSVTRGRLLWNRAHWLAALGRPNAADRAEARRIFATQSLAPQTANWTIPALEEAAG